MFTRTRSSMPRMLNRLPPYSGTRLSTSVTFAPKSTSFIARLEPINPNPPVISTLVPANRSRSLADGDGTFGSLMRASRFQRHSGLRRPRSRTLCPVGLPRLEQPAAEGTRSSDRRSDDETRPAATDPFVNHPLGIGRQFAKDCVRHCDVGTAAQIEREAKLLVHAGDDPSEQPIPF